ncbi:Androgen-induced gene 1 protein [Anabarilius grahami]|uniref:Androgen-induced gene 1 protein n=1 Tax=Anabarilius grahami TaxID=495550 RepID=A0A3N0Z5A3_ANAGA|nr:Androgen-induced gene 1 protein [Anabarilius grahami]
MNGRHIDSVVTASAAFQTLDLADRRTDTLHRSRVQRMCWVHSMTGVWVYPLLEHIGPMARIFFFICLTALINVYYVLGEILNNYIWDSSKSKLKGEFT